MRLLKLWGCQCHSCGKSQDSAAEYFFFAAEFFKSVVHFNTMFVKIHFLCLFGKENRLKNEKEYLFLSKPCMAIS